MGEFIKENVEKINFQKNNQPEHYSCSPKISVIIPVYNVEKYLVECLESVISQTLKEIEIICINDGSTDNSLKILEELALKDNRIKIINKENEGPAATRNLGIKLAIGEYISFVDADDYLGSKDFYLRLYNKAVETKSNIVKSTYKAEKDGSITAFINEEVKKDKNSFCMQFCSAIYNTDFLIKNEIFFPNINDMEDPVFAFQSALLANNVEIINDVSYVVVDNPNSITRRNIREKQINEKIEGLDLIIQLANNANISSHCYIYVTCLWFTIIYRDILKNKNVFVRQRALKKLRFLWNKLKLTEELKYKVKSFDKDCYIYFAKPFGYRFCNMLVQSSFSIRNSPNKKHKILTILGIKIKFRKKLK